MPVELYMPKMSDHMEKGTILTWLVEAGTQVTERQPVLEVETDKVVAEVEAPASGILDGIRASPGAEVRVGEIIAFIVQPGETVPDLPPLVAPTAAPLPMRQPAPASKLASGDEGVKASPVARKLARERGIDLRLVHGTGPGGRITQEDVLAFAGTVHVEAAPSPPPAGAPTEDVYYLDLTPARRIAGERLSRSWQQAPHFTLTMAADMSEAMRLKEALQDKVKAETGHGLSYTALLVRVVAVALRDHPLANAEFCDRRIKVHRQINIGVATNTDVGLLVPVIRAADTLRLAEIARELAAIREKAASRGFTPDDLSGGTFTITNLGMYGVDSFAAVINPPQSAILAIGRILSMPLSRGNGLSSVVRPAVNLTLSVDHRVLDGVAGAAFLSTVKRLLENPYQLL